MDLDATTKSANYPKTARGRRTRGLLLQAAENVFAEKGYHGASVTEITQAAGVGAGTFYLYFTTKMALFQAVVDALQSELRASLRGAEGSSRLERERQGLRSFLSFARARPKLFRILQESYIVDPAIYFSYFESIAESYTKRLADAQAKGEVSEGDPDIQAWCLIAISNFLGMRYTQPGWETVDLDAVIRTAGTLITHGLAPVPPIANTPGPGHGGIAKPRKKKPMLDSGLL